MASNILALLAALPLCINAAPNLLPRQNFRDTALVDLTTYARRGPPQNLASGILYGIPDDPTQIPDQFYSDIGYNYARIGGAQMTAGGWVQGLDTYYARFNNTRDNYHQARKFGAKVVILPHDIWGTDHANASTHWPGDNGDWTDYDKYLDQLISDLKANNMLEGLVYDTWNEADGYFWARSLSQYLDLWSRTYKRIRQDPALSGVLISGPSHASQPSTGNPWWTQFAQRVVADKTIPDQYAWHDEPGDVANDIPTWDFIRQQYNLPEREININEYAVFDEQISAGAAWWISRLERYNLRGLRGNWLSNWQLRDFLASLLTKTNTNDYTGTGYAGNGEFNVYKYYHQNMTGERATTTTTGDGVMDVYATVGADKVRVLTGVHNQQGTWYITISGLSTLGLNSSGSLNIQTWGFDDAGHYGAVSGPSNRGVFAHQYDNDYVSFPVFQTAQDQHTAWAFEFDVPVNPPAPKPSQDCGRQPGAYGPLSHTPDTPEGFSNNPEYGNEARSASTPKYYTSAFTALTASISQGGYLGYRTLTSYDPSACAVHCASISACKAFNIFFQRDPTLKPAAACPNPTSQTTIGCALYSQPVSAANAKNGGQTRQKFRTVIAGSNGYNLAGKA